jgi:predicted metal-dependent hydrolase
MYAPLVMPMSWRLNKASIAVIDHVIVHALAHLLEGEI